MKRPQSLGAALRAVREGRGVTQVEVAAKLGVAQTSISAWERDKDRPTLEAIRDFERYIGTEVGTVLRLAGFAPAGGGTEAAILSDPMLSPEDRDLVVGVYRKCAK